MKIFLLLILSAVVAFAQNAIYFPSIKVGDVNSNSKTNTGSVVIRTNFISGQLYTNTFGLPVTVYATFHLTNAAVNGFSQVDLVVGGIRTNSIAESTITTIVARWTRRQVVDTVLAGEQYYFTNRSSGSGNAVTVVAGSGAIVIP